MVSSCSTPLDDVDGLDLNASVCFFSNGSSGASCCIGGFDPFFGGGGFVLADAVVARY